MALLVLLAASVPAGAQVIFGSVVDSPDGPVHAVFQVNDGTVTQVKTGLPNNQYPSISRDGGQLVISSPDPQRPFEASWDLFAFDRNTGQTRKLVDNETQELPDGSRHFASPQFSHTSADGQLVAFVNLRSHTGPHGGSSTRFLEVVRSSDGAPVSLAEIGAPSGQTDFYQSEFLGVSWSPNAREFATPAYVPANEQGMVAAGIVVYGENQFGQFVRARQLTQPSVINMGTTIVAHTHALPSFSPNGQLLAFFRITYINPLMSEPAQAGLMVLDIGSGQPPVEVVTFQPGVFPAGVGWSQDGTQLVFAFGNQSQTGPVGQGGSFQPLFVPETAELRTFDLGTGQIAAIAGAPVGFFPSGGPLPNTIFRGGFEQ